MIRTLVARNPANVQPAIHISERLRLPVWRPLYLLTTKSGKNLPFNIRMLACAFLDEPATVQG